MSLTTDFMSNFQQFMRSRVLLIPSQVPAGDGSFQLQAQGDHAALVGAAGSGTAIHGYYVHPDANDNNEYALPRLPRKQPYFMLTDGLNGCQFIAYGPARQHLTVEHNNFIDNAANYAARIGHIRQQNPTYLFQVSAGDNDQITHGTYARQHGINIVGEYTSANHWRFWIRDRLDQNQGTLYGPF